MTRDTDLLRDVVDDHHLCAALGLTSPAAALLAGHRRPAATLSATSCLTWLARPLTH